MKELFPINMLGEVDTKMLDSIQGKCHVGTAIEKASLTQYVRRGWHKNFFSVKMLGAVSTKNPFT